MSTNRPIIVIGGGVGGLVAAARLALEGHAPLLLEATDRLGGRFSTIEQDGYRLPTGAVAIETAGPFWETFGELGIDPGLRVPDPPVMVHVRGRDLKPGAAVWEHMMKRVTKAAGRIAEGIGRSRDSGGEENITLEQWVRRYTGSKTLLSLFQSLSASIFTVNADELDAGVFFRLLRETGGYKHFGYAPYGNVVLADAIAGEAVRRGGEVRLGWAATSIEVEGGEAVAVLATDPDGVAHRLPAAAVVSNVGPINTARLLEGGPVASAFAERIRGVRTTSLLALAFTSHEELIPHPGIWVFTDTQRLCNLANLSATCPELAPAGRTLYEAYSAPRPSVGGQYDAGAERGLLEADLRRVIPGFAEKAEVVLFKAMGGLQAPAQQCVPGHDLSVETPVPNLVEVGDGVKPYGWIGTTACAQTARLAVDVLLKAPALAEPSLTGGTA
jgi:phytoene dehydrogenase-like protein